MPSDAKITQLIVGLTKATVAKKIEWEFAEPPRSIATGTGDIIPAYLQAEYKGKSLALFERRYREYDPENDDHYWTSGFVLAILDENSRVIWDYREGYSTLEDLFRVARESAADIDNLLDTLAE